jgi:hypothetical protein
MSLIAASRVGYTRAVPTPKSDIPMISPKYELAENNTIQIPTA